MRRNDELAPTSLKITLTHIVKLGRNSPMLDSTIVQLLYNSMLDLVSQHLIPTKPDEKQD